MPAEPAPRPDRLVMVVGTGTGVGKTWVSARLLERLRAAGHPVAARKPAQSFHPQDHPEGTDAAVLGRATGEPAGEVCPPARWYPVAMAPPMAAVRLGRPQLFWDDLVAGVTWPSGVGVGVV
ncbi:MAG: ATP-dependent dethiobiotin synthetase BioD, partial [Acidimicrobiales bacterium]